MLIKSALRIHLSVSYGIVSILVISRCAAPPYPAAPDFPPSGGQNKTPRDNLLINPPLEMTVLADTPIVISTEAKRSGEISPSDGTGGITLGDLSTQSFIKAFSICPIPTCGSARDDGVGERPHRHFDRSKAEWRNLTPPWYRKHWGGRSLDSEFHRSGFPLTPIPAHPPARDDDIGGHPYRHFDRSGAEWRNLTPQWAKKELGFRRWLFRRAALPSLWGREADQSAR